jgi:hypothetical protein
VVRVFVLQKGKGPEHFTFSVNHRFVFQTARLVLVLHDITEQNPLGQISTPFFRLFNVCLFVRACASSMSWLCGALDGFF